MAQVQAFIAQTETQSDELSALPLALAMGCKTAAPSSADASQLVLKQRYGIAIAQNAEQRHTNQGG